MSDLLTRFDITLHDRVQRLRERLSDMRGKADTGAHRLGDEFYEYIDEIEDVLEKGRERVAAASDILEDVVFESKDNIQDWKTRREIKKLRKEAERTQHYAEAALDVAIGALDEAEWALARAFMARSYADEIKDEETAA